MSRPRPDRRGKPRTDAGLRAAIDACGGITELAAFLEISKQAVSQWTEIPQDRLDEIAAITGLPLATLKAGGLKND